MHELSIVQSLLDQVRRETEQAGAVGRVTRLELTVGRMSGVHVDALRFAFETLAPGTPMETTKLEITEPAAFCSCGSCGQQSEIDQFVVECPRCGASDVLVEGGQELVLQSIEVEEE